MSHFANLLHEASRWTWLASFFRADGRFHYIHARDIARTMRVLIHAKDMPGAQPARIVLGNPATTVNGFLDDFLRYRGIRNPIKFTLRETYAQVLIKVFRIPLGLVGRSGERVLDAHEVLGKSAAEDDADHRISGQYALTLHHVHAADRGHWREPEFLPRHDANEHVSRLAAQGIWH
jgi:hypothetical protein